MKSAEPNNLVIEQEIFDHMINTSVALAKEIQNKKEQNITVTEAESAWVDSFVDYAKSITKALEKIKDTDQNDKENCFDEKINE